MSASLATLACACGIAGLFFLARDKSVHTSSALWLPVIWLSLNGSRSASMWLGMAPTDSADLQLDGSPVDRFIFSVLLAAALVVLVRRRKNANIFRRIDWSILAYLAYCLLSCIWSDFPDVSAKRWIKAIGDLAMVLIIVTDGNPMGALRRVFSRVGFILLPASVLLIKYYPASGRDFDPWQGIGVNTGVTRNKNSLGVIVFVISLGALWSILALLRSKDQPNRGRHLLAQAILLAFGLALLEMANSATSLACFCMGAVLMLATSRPAISRRPGTVHALILMMVLLGVVTMLFGGGAGIVHALGRKTDFTGRTDIWKVLIPMAPDPLLGAGFESFWLGPRVDRVRHAFEGNPLNEAHNGYLEVYLNLGWIGVGLIAWILISGYRHAAVVFRRDPPLGSLLLAYVASSVLYSVTEAGFRMLLPLWFFLLLAVVRTSPTISDGKEVTLPRFNARTDRGARSLTGRSVPSLRGTKA